MWQPEWEELDVDERARCSARQGVAYLTGSTCAWSTRAWRRARDGATLGEVVMRGNNVMKGYYREPRPTAEAFRGGWFHSGDLAVMHPDGYIELRDRAKDIIISGGENISTIEVEQAVASHPAVLECAVVAMPDEKWGERPKAFVTLKPGAAATGGEIIDFCRERLAHFKCPAAVEFGELPKTSTGKIQKYVLREREWAGGVSGWVGAPRRGLRAGGQATGSPSSAPTPPRCWRRRSPFRQPVSCSSRSTFA